MIHHFLCIMELIMWLVAEIGMLVTFIWAMLEKDYQRASAACAGAIYFHLKWSWTNEKIKNQFEKGKP